MTRTGVVIQARMSSERLPGKVLRAVGDRPVLGCLLDRLAQAERVDAVVVATSDRPDDDPVAAFAEAAGIPVHRGPLEDVLGRFAAAARAAGLEHVVRVSGDSPLLDPALVDLALRGLAGGRWDAASNVMGERTYPAGQSVEAMTARTLDRLDQRTTDPADREHVTPLLYRRPDLFRVLPIRRAPATRVPHLAVDTPDDLARVTEIVGRMRRPQWSYGLDELLDLSDAA